jgi:hypothetical protein
MDAQQILTELQTLRSAEPATTLPCLRELSEAVEQSVVPESSTVRLVDFKEGITPAHFARSRACARPHRPTRRRAAICPLSCRDSFLENGIQSAKCLDQLAGGSYRERRVDSRRRRTWRESRSALPGISETQEAPIASRVSQQPAFASNPGGPPVAGYSSDINHRFERA